MTRSENMRRIRSKDTAPELAVRRLLRECGFSGYRLHRKDLPGKPDVAFLGRKKAIQVHGCFWHGHDCTEGLRRPKSHQEYWVPKIDRTRERDRLQETTLAALGWGVLTIWECELTEMDRLRDKIVSFMTDADAGLLAT